MAGSDDRGSGMTQDPGGLYAYLAELRDWSGGPPSFVRLAADNGLDAWERARALAAEERATLVGLWTEVGQ